MGQERPGHTLQTTALVNEAYLRLIDASQVRWQNRAHFFAVSAGVLTGASWSISRALITSSSGAARHAGSLWMKRWWSVRIKVRTWWRSTMRCQRFRPSTGRQSQVVELRFFGGLSVEETAEVLTVSPTTVRRDWTLARAWLHHELSKQRRVISNPVTRSVITHPASLSS